MRKITAALAAFLLCALAHGQGGIESNSALRSTAGVAATVRVCTAAATGTPCSPLASIYTDSGLSIAKSNPFATDSVGNYSFYAAAAFYKVQITVGATTYEMPIQIATDLSGGLATFQITDHLKLDTAGGPDDCHKLYGNSDTTLPSEASLGVNDHCFIQYKDAASPLSWRHFMHSRTGSVPENEFLIEAYYHPGFVLDQIAAGAASRSSIVWRKNGVGQWALQMDTADNGTKDFIILSNADDVTNAICRLCFNPVPTILNTLGVGTTVQTFLRGNTQVRGSIESEALYNNTTGRAAFSFLKTSGERLWLRHSGVRQVTLATDRDGGTEYVTLGGDSGIGNGGEFYLWGVGGVGATDYERLFIGNTAGGEFNILTQQGGTGTSRTLNLGATGAAGQIQFKINNAGQWIVNTSGDLITASDGLNDIGLSGNNRPANIFASVEMRAPTLKATTAFISSAADPADAGLVRLANAEQVCWEAAPAGGDICIDTDSGEILNLGGVNASGVNVNAELTVGAGGMAANAAGFKHIRTTEGCATAASAGATCDVTVTWGTAFADTNYTAQCDGFGITAAVPLNGGIVSVATTGVVFRTVAATAAAAEFDKVWCTAVHD
jgi:hypothetical protein